MYETSLVGAGPKTHLEAPTVKLKLELGMRISKTGTAHAILQEHIYIYIIYLLIVLNKYICMYQMSSSVQPVAFSLQFTHHSG